MSSCELCFSINKLFDRPNYLARQNTYIVAAVECTKPGQCSAIPRLSIPAISVFVKHISKVDYSDAAKENSVLDLTVA